MVRRLAVASMMTIGLVLFVAGWARPAGASPEKKILAPTSVRAVSVDGVSGVLVSWRPLPAGGPTVLYYLATTYNRRHTCKVPATGPYSCVLAGLRGNRHFSINVQAFTESGVSQSGQATQTVIAPGTAPAESAATTAASTHVPIAPATTTTSDAALPELPYTGIDIPTLLFLGLGLSASGLLLVSSKAKRRLVRRHLLWWMFGI